MTRRSIAAASATPIPLSGDGGNVVVVVVVTDDVEVEPVGLSSAAVVSTGARVVIAAVVSTASSSPPQAEATRATANNVMRYLEIVTGPECIPAAETTRVGTASVDFMDDLVSFVAGELAKRADPEKAAPMAAYLKTEMPFYGVQKRGRTEVMRELKSRFPIADAATYRSAVESLWNRPHREEKYMAIALARQHSAFVTLENLDLYQRMIEEGAWWDLVDDIAINCVGIVYLKERKRTEATIEAWVDDEVMWLRRTSLISPIKHKTATDYEMLFDHCVRRSGEKEFFIRKAIGWTLREYAKTEPDRVASFLLQHRDLWSGLSFREASKHLDLTI